MKYPKIFFISCLLLSILSFLFQKSLYYVISPPDAIYTHDPSHVTTDNPTGMKIKHVTEGMNPILLVLMIIIFFVGGFIFLPAWLLFSTLIKIPQLTLQWIATPIVVILTAGFITLFVYWWDRRPKRNPLK